MITDSPHSMLRFRALKIAYSWRCNASCEHCMVSSDPRRKEKLTPEDVQQCIEDAAALGIGRLEFTGGEIMLFANDLDKFLNYSHERGLTVTLDTNAFWAKDVHTAYKRLSHLKSLGVDCLHLSTDSFHSQFVDLSCVLNALDAADRTNVFCDVTICVVRDDPHTLGIISHLFKYRTRIRIQHVAPFGRAEKLDHRRMFRSGIEQVGTPCENIYAPLVAPDGRVCLCCAPPSQFPQSIAKISPLILGWLDSERLESILLRAQDDPLLNLFAAEGMGGLLERFKKLNPCGLRLESQDYFGRCDLCTQVFACPSRVKQFRSSMPRLLTTQPEVSSVEAT